MEISFSMSWVDDFLSTFGGISDKYEKKVALMYLSL
jgi:hypothetical protein